MILLLFFFLNYSINFSLFEIYTPYEIFNFLNKQNITQKDAQLIKDNLIKILDETYAYYEISKNPPQNDFDYNYHNKVDIQKELNEIKTENRNKYGFYQDLLKALCKLRDGHISLSFIDLNKIIENFACISPIQLNIDLDYNNKPKMFSISQIINDEMQSYFRDYENIFEIIEKNNDVPIKSINGENPFDFISNFGKDYKYLRSPHANFPLKFNLLQDFYSLSHLPLSIEELTNFTVVYENGNHFTTDYIIMSFYDIYENDDNIILNQAKAQLDLKNIFTPKNQVLKNKIKKIISKNYKKKNENLRLLYEEDDESLDWDYNFTEIFKCRVDNVNEVNVYMIKSLLSEDINTFIDIIQKCGELFDNNTYPVILINNLNEGGINNISQFLLETLSTFSTLNYYVSFRKTDNIVKYYSNIHLSENEPELYTIENCENFNKKEFSNKGKKIDYGSGISDILTEPFILNGKDFRKKLEKYKSKLKNPRKPTDIIVFTDGYSFSSASLFIKLMQYYGGGITVGYFGNPKEENIPFDSSQSPSGIFLNDSLYRISNEYKELFEKYGFIMELSSFQIFFNKYNMKIPLEYEVSPVDEIIKYYKFYSDENYNEFIYLSKNILNKYKNKCNPKNKKLLLLTNECDKYFINNYTHGGYECGDDGIWTERCVPSYCEPGYIFDHEKKKCIDDVCSEIEVFKEKETDFTNKNTKNLLLIFLIPLGILVLLIVIIYLIIFIKKGKKKNNIDSKDIPDIPNALDIDILKTIN